MTQRKQLPEFSFTNLLKGFIFSNVGEAKGTLLKRFVSSKMAFECTISTSESICFGELRKCPSALWAYIESGIGFWLSGKDLRKRWFVYCQAGLKTIGLEYMPEKDGVAWHMEWDGRRLKPCGIEKDRRSITWWRSRIFHFLSWQPESDVMTVFSPDATILFGIQKLTLFYNKPSQLRIHLWSKHFKWGNNHLLIHSDGFLFTKNDFVPILRKLSSFSSQRYKLKVW